MNTSSGNKVTSTSYRRKATYMNTYQASDNKCTLTVIARTIEQAKRILKAENCAKGMKIQLFEKNSSDADEGYIE